MDKEFRCKGMRLAYYLMEHGSTFIRYEHEDGDVVFIFEHDDTIQDNLGKWEFMLKRCLF